MISFIKEWILICAAYAYSMIRGRAVKKPPAIQKILVVQMAKLGDMVCTTPVFYVIKKKYPDAKLVVLGNKVNEALLVHNPDIDEYIVAGSFKEMLVRFRAEKFDCAILAGGPNSFMLAAAFFAGIPLVVAPHIVNGWSPWQTIRYRSISRLVIQKDHRMGFYAPREYLRLLEPLGIMTDDTTKHLGYSKEAAAKVERLISDWAAASVTIDKRSGVIQKTSKILVGITPSAGNRIKQWPPARFAEVAEYLIEKRNAAVIIFGGPGDTAEVSEMLAHVKNQNAIFNLQGKLSLDELKAAVDALDLFMGVDTGPIYIAEAFGVPTVDIVGPVDEREQPPIDSTHVVVVPPQRTKPELHVMNARSYDYNEARRQTESITVDMVTAAINDVFQRL